MIKVNNKKDENKFNNKKIVSTEIVLKSWLDQLQTTGNSEIALLPGKELKCQKWVGLEMTIKGMVIFNFSNFSTFLIF